jgi:alanine-glyoxylate transaminase / serine-glyoxylate transaminase / serine-pyruvate transaminase
MQAYESGKPAYFATPPVNLIYAFHTSLTSITKNPSISLEERFKRHKQVSARVKAAARELGLKQLAAADEVAAHGMTAVYCVLISGLSLQKIDRGVQLYFPDGLAASDVVPRLAQKDVVVAGGLIAQVKGLSKISLIYLI